MPQSPTAYVVWAGIAIRQSTYFWPSEMLKLPQVKTPGAKGEGGGGVGGDGGGGSGGEGGAGLA